MSPGVGNSAWTRRYKDVVVGHASDLGSMGLLFEAQISLIKRIVAMGIEIKQMGSYLRVRRLKQREHSSIGEPASGDERPSNVGTW